VAYPAASIGLFGLLALMRRMTTEWSCTLLG
jgi:hypothetical protein